MASLSCVAHELKFGKKLVHRNSNVCSISGWLAESQQIQSKGNILQWSNTSETTAAGDTFLQENNLIGRMWKTNNVEIQDSGLAV